MLLKLFVLALLKSECESLIVVSVLKYIPVYFNPVYLFYKIVM